MSEHKFPESHVETIVRGGREMTHLADVLARYRRARELISDENKWCQGAEARGYGGFTCDPLDQCAIKWCALGALAKVGVDPIHMYAVAPSAYVGDYNDTHSHAEVLGLFDRAIATLEHQLAGALPAEAAK